MGNRDVRHLPLQALEVAEQTYHLKVNAGPTKYSALAASSGVVHVTAFAFGPPTAWGMLTVFFLCSHGGVLALCPVAPFGLKVGLGWGSGLVLARQHADAVMRRGLRFRDNHCSGFGAGRPGCCTSPLQPGPKPWP